MSQFGLITLDVAMGIAAMAEWQILRPSEKTAETIGFVFAESEEQALTVAFRKFEITDPQLQEQIVAIKSVSDR